MAFWQNIVLQTHYNILIYNTSQSMLFQNFLLTKILHKVNLEQDKKGFYNFKAIEFFG